MKRHSKLGLGLFFTIAAGPVFGGPLQGPSDAPPSASTESAPRRQVERLALRPLIEGPLHESFLSPRRDRDDRRIPKSPPPAVIERPAIDPPSPKAVWIEGYWEWDAGRKDFVWVTGSWRVPPPGRFWVNGYWKRDDDGWYRVKGFWSDRKTDRIDYRKDGPPAFRPDDDPGQPPASETADFFYVPGEYHPDGDGVVWKKGFWAEARPGWSWVPASWTRQPGGWVFQDGYWDRTLEGRGILFAPAEMTGDAESADDLTYQPYTIVSPQMYGQLYGALGRANSYYDGYPGVCYDDDGRYYGYGDYGNLSGYYGYLDYPFYGGYGYPYYAAPLSYASYGGIGYGYPYYGNLLGGALGLGFGYPLSPFLPYGYNGLGGYGGYGVYSWGGLGYGNPYSGLGYGGYGWGGGYGGFGNWGGFGFPGWGLGGFPLLAWTFGGLGLGGFGFPGLLYGPYNNNQGWNNLPYQNSGRHHMANGGHPPNGWNGGRPGAGGNAGQGGAGGSGGRPTNPPANRPGGSNIAGLPSRGFMRSGSGAAGAGAVARHAVQPPPSSRPFASLASHRAATGNGGSGALRNASMRTAGASHVAPAAGSWNHAYNGVSRPAAVHHAVARPAFTSNAAAAGAAVHRGAAGSFVPQMRGAPAGAATAANPALGARANAFNPGLANPGLGGRGLGSAATRPGAGFTPQTRAFTAPNAGLGNLGAMRGGAMRSPSLGGGFNPGAMRSPSLGSFNAGAMRAPSLGGGFNGGAMRGGLGSGFNGGFNPGGMHAGGLSPSALGGGFGGGGMRGGGFGGMGGGMGGGFGGGMGGGHMGGGGFGGGMGGGGFGGGMGGGGFSGGHMR